MRGPEREGMLLKITRWSAGWQLDGPACGGGLEHYGGTAPGLAVNAGSGGYW